MRHNCLVLVEALHYSISPPWVLGVVRASWSRSMFAWAVGSTRCKPPWAVHGRRVLGRGRTVGLNSSPWSGNTFSCSITHHHLSHQLACTPWHRGGRGSSCGGCFSPEVLAILQRAPCPCNRGWSKRPGGQLLCLPLERRVCCPQLGYLQ